jgi:PhzF family phenazine biosynthesis protein
MKRVRFKQIDVFTTEPFTGNPAGVVLDATNLTDEQMQAIALEMNLSETTFVLPATVPNADYRVRFFSPRSELPFAGHPTLATVLAVIEEGQVFQKEIPQLVLQECGIGVVPVVVEQQQGNHLFFLMDQAPPHWISMDISKLECAAMLGCENDEIIDIPVAIVSTGVPWLIIPLKSLQNIQALKPDMGLIEQTCKEFGAYGVTTFCLNAGQHKHQVHARSFAPGAGVSEDPVCGTGNGSIAAYIAQHGLIQGQRFEYVAEQGIEIGRPGLVTVKAQLDSDGMWKIQIGGQAIKILEGELLF